MLGSPTLRLVVYLRKSWAGTPVKFRPATALETTCSGTSTPALRSSPGETGSQELDL